MIFTARIGDDDGNRTWQRQTDAHAAWLGLEASFQTSRSYAGAAVSLGVLLPRNRTSPVMRLEEGRYLLFHSEPGPFQAPETTDDPRRWQESLLRLDRNTVRVGLNPLGGELRVVVPPATPDAVFWAETPGGCVIANDFRLLARIKGWDLDQRGVYSLLQYCAIPPPFTLCQNVSQVPGGHELRMVADSREPELKAVFHLKGRPAATEASDVSPEEQLMERLDTLLTPTPSGSVLCFSGGWDSGLLAWRLRELGYNDLPLIHLTFQTSDPEIRWARKMASHLGLPYEPVLFDPAGIPRMIERIGLQYATPFGDQATLQTDSLLEACRSARGSDGVVIDGTGADGLFGIGPKYRRWRSIYRLPAPARQGAGALYASLGLWKTKSGLEFISRLCRRSAQMPLLLAGVMAMNALNGIAYRIPGSVLREINEATERYRLLLASHLPPEDRFALLDLLHLCAGEFATKMAAPLRRDDIASAFPYLEPTMLELGFSLPWETKCADGTTKGLIKNLLLRRFPKEWIDRQKSGFLPPLAGLLAQPALKPKVLETLRNTDNPIRDFCDRAVLDELSKRIEQGTPMNLGTYNFLWTFFFASQWLEQQDR